VEEYDEAELAKLIPLEVDVTSDKLKDALKSIGQYLSGCEIKIQLTFPLELVGRCVKNMLVESLKDTDLGVLFKDLTQNELSSINQGVNKLQKADLEAAAHGCEKVLGCIQTIFSLEKGSKEYKQELKEISTHADNTIQNATLAFGKVKSAEEQIRCIVISCTCIKAKAAITARAGTGARSDLGSEIRRLFSVQMLVNDIRAGRQVCGRIFREHRH
jgi:hypothetical protein